MSASPDTFIGAGALLLSGIVAWAGARRADRKDRAATAKQIRDDLAQAKAEGRKEALDEAETNARIENLERKLREQRRRDGHPDD